ncbi:MAG: hypothetical protein ACRYGC_10270 [Janthinobacterium lividum]
MDTNSFVGSTLRVLPPVIRAAPSTAPTAPVPSDGTIGGDAGGATGRRLLRIAV